jgi:hypothetical protein
MNQTKKNAEVESMNPDEVRQTEETIAGSTVEEGDDAGS